MSEEQYLVKLIMCATLHIISHWYFTWHPVSYDLTSIDKMINAFFNGNPIP